MDEGSDLHQYLLVIWRRRWTWALVTIVAIALALGYSALTKKVYQGTASLELTPQLSSTLQEANNANNPYVTVDVPTDLLIIKSSSVSDYVKKSIPNAPSVSASEVATTAVVDVSCQSTNAALAAKCANAYANAFITLQQQEAQNTLTSASQAIEVHLNSLQAQINSVTSRITAGGVGAAGLTTQLQLLETQQSTLQNTLTNYQFAASVETGGGTIVSQATVPTKPVKPKTIEYTILAGVLGLILGLGLALLLEYLDDGLRTRADLERVAGDRPVLGLIPEIVDWRDSHATFLVTRAAPKSPAAESYRGLRTSIQFLGLDHSIRTLQFTSPSAAEGKSTTMANLAVVSAQAGLRVVMVCCDLRRPRLHEFFGAPNQVGFTSVLLGQATLAEALQPIAGFSRLRLLASGPIPPNPSELLSGERTGELLRTIGADADLVLIDSPPVLPVTDAVVLGRRADAVVLVVTSGQSTRSQVARALETLSQVDAPVSGVILNRASDSDAYSYYRYAYGAPSKSPAQPQNGRASRLRVGR